MILIRKIIAPTFTKLLIPALKVPVRSFSYMSLFQQPKKPQQLSSIFKKPTRIKGHLKQKRRSGRVSIKLAQKKKIKQLRLRNSKAMLYRVKIVGPRFNRRFKRLHSESRHKRWSKSKANLLRKRRPAYVSTADMYKVKKLIPYYKRRSLKNRY